MLPPPSSAARLPAICQRLAREVSEAAAVAADLVAAALGRGGLPWAPRWALVGQDALSGAPHRDSSRDPLGAGFGAILWNTPKRRRPLEKRHLNKFWSLNHKAFGVNKVLRPKRTLRFDHATGETFELGKLPPQHYKDVMDETKEIQAKMAEAFDRQPRDKEVVVVYKGEGAEKEDFGVDRQRVKVLEMEKERPAFFSQALLQRGHKTPAARARDEATTTVRPSGLG